MAAPVDGDPVSSFVDHTLLTGLRTIRKANGYHTDLGKRVSEDVITIPDSDGIVLDEELIEPADESTVGQYDMVRYKKVRFFHTANESEAQALIRKCFADVRKYMEGATIYVNSPMGGGAFQNLPLRVKFKNAALNAGGLINGLANGWALFEVIHIEALSNPAIAKAV